MIVRTVLYPDSAVGVSFIQERGHLRGPSADPVTLDGEANHCQHKRDILGKSRLLRLKITRDFSDTWITWLKRL